MIMSGKPELEIRFLINLIEKISQSITSVIMTVKKFSLYTAWKRMCNDYIHIPICSFKNIPAVIYFLHTWKLFFLHCNTKFAILLIMTFCATECKNTISVNFKNISSAKMKNVICDFLYLTAMPIFDRIFLQHIEIFVIAVYPERSPRFIVQPFQPMIKDSF